MNRIDKSMELATLAHEGQTRKYTGEPYVEHAQRVAALVKLATKDEATICAALLHDTIEDTGLTFHGITENIGRDVADMVIALTKPHCYERTVGNATYRTRIAHYPAEIHMIKLADIADNCATIAALDPVFAGPYLLEKRALLEVLTKGDPVLYHLAAKRVFDGLRKLKLI